MIGNWKFKLLISVVCGLILYNIIAYNQAYAMLHFSEGGTRTAAPEALTLIEKVVTIFTGINLPKPVNEQTPADFDLPYNTERLVVDSGMEIELWSIPLTDAPGTVILFHGYGSSKSTLLGPAEAFRRLGYGTLLVDFRGSGGSDGTVTTVGYVETAEVLAAINWVRSTHGNNHQIILYGQSMGGAAILRAVGKEGADPDLIIIEAVFDEIVATVGNRFRSMGLPAWPSAQILTFWGGVQIGYPGFRHNPVEYAADIEVPTLVMYAENDPRVSVEQAQRVYAALTTEQKIEQLFEDAVHESFYFVDSDLWNRTVAKFLERYVE